MRQMRNFTEVLIASRACHGTAPLMHRSRTASGVELALYRTDKPNTLYAKWLSEERGRKSFSPLNRADFEARQTKRPQRGGLTT